MRLVTIFQEISEISGEEVISNSAFLLVMILLYLNIALYLMDLYALVKKKSPGETVMIMLLPGAITVMGAALFSFFLQIPANTGLERVWTENVSPGLWAEMLGLAGLFAFLWCLTWRLWQRKRENRLRVAQWIFSYSLDFFMVFLLLVVGGAGLIGGVDLPVLAGRLVAGLGYNLFLYLFLYGVAALAFKMGLFLLAGLTQIFSVRVYRFPYREGKSPTASFLLYAVLCQNARVRGALAYWIPMLCFGVWTMGEADDFVFRVVFPIFIVLAFLLYLLIAVRPIADNMARFSKWGDRKQVLAQFCREYFLEEPLIKNRDFTVTRHFLADERGMIEVFAFEALANVKGGWVSDPKNGWVRSLPFLDGGNCAICKGDMGADEIFRYARQYWETQQLANRGKAELQRLQEPAKEGLYQKLFYFVVAALVMMFMVIPQMMKG